MQAVILAGGKGRQIQSVDSIVPKPLLPLFDRPLIEHSIRLMAKHGITEIFIAASEAGQDIMNYLGDGSHWGVHIRYSIESEPLGTAGAVKLLQNQLSGTFLVFSGDLATDADLSAAIGQHESSKAIASILTSAVDDPTEYGMVAMDKSGKLTRILEKPRSSEATSGTISTGIYILEPEALSSIPYYHVCDFSLEVFPRMINNSEPVMGIELKGYWSDLGNLLDYRQAHFNALINELKLDMPVEQVAAGIWVGKDVKVHSSAQLTGPLFLGDEVTIGKNAVIGKNSVIGTGATIAESVSISHSIIGSRSLINAGSEVTNCIIEGSYNLPKSTMLQGKTLLTQARYTAPRPTANPIRIPRPKPSTTEPVFATDADIQQSESIVR